MKKIVKRIVKTAPVKETKKRKPLTQEDRVFEYLVDAGKKGATNFEMMMNLRMCDVRKRISTLIREPIYDYEIVSDFEVSDDGKKYKRYWAMPVGYNSLAEWLYETKRVGKIAKKRTGGGFR